jgi:hypothetical protein
MIATSPRAVLSDDGKTLRLTIYRGSARLAAELSPLQAVMLARELLQAAIPKLPSAAGTTPAGATTPIPSTTDDAATPVTGSSSCGASGT